MKVPTKTFNAKTQGRLAGLFYLIIIAAGLYGGLMVRGTLVVLDDPIATFNNFMQHEQLFRVGFMSDLTMVIADVIIAILFYQLLRSTDEWIAKTATIFRLMQAAILGANLIHLFTPILQLAAFNESTVDQASFGQELLLQMQIFEYGYLISGVFFAINCFLMGYLLYRSNLYPAFLGVMMGLAGIGYLTNCVASFAVPTFVEMSQIIMFFTAVIAEVCFCVYLLIWGAKPSK